MESTLIDYKPVTYKKFIAEFERCYEAYKKSTGLAEVDLAVCIGKSSMTVRNCFAPMKQVVSDKILTNLISCIGMKAKVEWVDAVRYYYIENN